MGATDNWRGTEKMAHTRGKARCAFQQGHTEDIRTRNRLGSMVKALTRMGWKGETVKYAAEGKN